MLEVEIRTPLYDEEAGQVKWRVLALVRADGDDLTIYRQDESEVISTEMPVIDAATGSRVTAAEDPERWVRNLPDAYRSGDLVAIVLTDTDAPAPTERPEDAATSAPRIPAPPQPAAMVFS